MFTIALVGVDGAGKTTIARRIQQHPALKIRYVYMGANPQSSNILLPTTRLILNLKQAMGKTNEKTSLRGENTGKPHPKGVGAHIKPYFWLVNRIAEEWFRQCMVWWYLLRGYMVIFDRHFFFDYYAYDIVNGGAGRPLPRRLHGWMLNRIFPRPDLVIFLDAPVHVLHQRKRETTLGYLVRRREEYRRFQEHFPNFKIVDANQDEEAVFQDVLQVIEDFRHDKNNSGSIRPAPVAVENNEIDGRERVV